MAPQGSKQVTILGKDDKRQFTAVFAISLAGKLLPPQLLYAGKTEKCHPNFAFPKDWDIWHSDSHWSTSETMVRYIIQVIVPFVEKMRSNVLAVPSTQKALVIFDMYRAQSSNTALYELLQKHNILYQLVPPSCTSELQPLDADGGINFQMKSALKGEFSNWYSERLLEDLNEGREIGKSEIDLRLSLLKPLHSKWLLKAFEKCKALPAALMVGCEKTGILSVYEKIRMEEEDEDELILTCYDYAY